MKRWLVTLTDPKRRGHSMPLEATCSSIGVGQEAGGWETAGRSLSCGFYTQATGKAG